MVQSKEEIAAYHREYNKKKREEKAKAVKIPRPEGTPTTAGGIVKVVSTTAPTIEESKKKLLDSFLGGLAEKPNTSTGTGPASGSPTPVGASPSPTTPAAGPARPVTLVIPPHIFVMISKTLNRLVDSNIYPCDEDTAMMLAESLGACMAGSKPMSPWMSFALACFIAYGLPTVLNIDVVMKKFKKGEKDGKPKAGFLGGIFGPREPSKPAEPKAPRIEVVERPELEPTRLEPVRAEGLTKSRDAFTGTLEHMRSTEERQDDPSPLDIPDAIGKKRGGALF